MDITPTPLLSLLLLTPRRHGDERGFFCETWNETALRDLSLDLIFVQDNQSFSTTAGTVRGLHYQSPPQAQDKLVRCGRGALFDVAVDVRRSSPTYGRWYGVELSFENGKQLLIPKGFLHGFMTLTDECEILYKCTAPYAPDCDGAVAWDDPEIGIKWPRTTTPILSDKDRLAPKFKDFESPFG